MQFVKVILRQALPSFDRVYTYKVPSRLEKEACPGRRVLFPFGGGDRLEEGFIFAPADAPAPEKSEKIKSLFACLDSAPLLLPNQLKLIFQMKMRYGCTYGQAAGLMLPYGVKLQISEELALTERGRKVLPPELLQHWEDTDSKTVPLADLQRAGFSRGELRRYEKEGLLEPERAAEQMIKSKTVEYCSLSAREEAAVLLEEQNLGSVQQEEAVRFLLQEGESPVHELLQACQIKRGTLRTLQKKKLLRFSRKKPEEQDLLPAFAEDLLPADERTIRTEDLTADQKKALAAVTAAVRAPLPEGERAEEFLLFGITGSGKTEVYLRASEAALEEGKTVILLVPEIALTPQMTARFEHRFPGEVAVMHSRLTARQRYDVWEQIREQKAKIVIGARSAVFAPLENLGLIMIDEEQEDSYRSDMSPRYQAATIARLRSINEGAVLLLGSATPSLESYVRSQSGKARLLRLSERPGKAYLPECKIIDLRKHWNSETDGLISRPLEDAMREALGRGEQVLLFLNRRGYAASCLCRNCGEAVQCPTCSVGMTYHKKRNRLLCHYCGHISEVPEVCPNCGEEALFLHGVGTQKLEQICRRLFPEVTLVRMDQDMTAGSFAHAKLLKKFREAGPAILIGTQMIAKGHDFPRLTVSAIISADQMLARNDIRAAEKAFQLITQTAGRAGRRDLPGQVFIQAFDVDHYALKAAADQDYETFAGEELAFRRLLSYPPYSAMASLVFSSEEEALCRQAAEASYRFLNARKKDPAFAALEVFRPARSPLAKLYGRWRWQMQLKAKGEHPVRTLSTVWQEISLQRRPRGLRVTFALDPA